MSKGINFTAGPCILPEIVFEEAANAVNKFTEEGLSILEISHRSTEFKGVMNEAISLVRELLNVPDDYSILFLQGGASLGFLMSAYNFFTKDLKKSAYIDSGTWANKAIKEARFLGTVDVLGSSEHKNYTYIPEFEVNDNYDYVHLTSNNTIYGTQFQSFPDLNVPLLCDMSSDLFSRKIDVSKFDLIYAGAQKNLGPAGTTLYIVKNNFIERNRLDIPTMLDLKTHIKKESMFNTPSVYSVYVSMLNLRYMKSIGGLDKIEELNNKKAELLYNALDNNSKFTTFAEKGSRSKMNVTFDITEERLRQKFDKLIKENKLIGLKGHISVGGYRASLYNALTIKDLKILADIIYDF